MKKSLIITIVCFVVGIVVLAGGFILLTDNEISRSIFTTTTTTAPAPAPIPTPEYKKFDFFKENLSEWITLGQYKGLTVGVNQLKVSESDIDMEIHIDLCQNDVYTKQFEGKIKEKEIFSFDFTGYLLKDDGTRDKAFDNGAGKNQLAYIDGNDLVTLTVGSTELGGFIDGFAQGMLGMSVDETKTLDITFPEDYHSADMAGKKVEFDVKINHIAKTTFDDATASHISNKKYTTVTAYRQNLRKELEEALKEQNKQSILLEILNNITIVASTEKQNEYVFGMLCSTIEYYVEYYSSFGYKVTFGDMLKQLGFDSVDALTKYSEEYAKSESGILEIKSQILPYALIAAEDIAVTDDDYKKFIADEVESSKKTEAEIVEMYGGEEVIKQIILLDKAEARLLEIIENENTCIKK